MNGNQTKVRRLLDRWDGYTTEAFWAEIVTPEGTRFVLILQVDPSRGDSIGIFRYEPGSDYETTVPQVEWFDDKNTDDYFASDLFVKLTGVVPALWEESGIKTVVSDYRNW